MWSPAGRRGSGDVSRLWHLTIVTCDHCRELAGVWTSDVLSGPVRCVYTDGGVAEGWASQGAWHGAFRRWRGDGSLMVYGRSVVTTSHRVMSSSSGAGTGDSTENAGSSCLGEGPCMGMLGWMTRSQATM